MPFVRRSIIEIKGPLLGIKAKPHHTSEILETVKALPEKMVAPMLQADSKWDYPDWLAETLWDRVPKTAKVSLQPAEVETMQEADGMLVNVVA